MTAPTKRKPRRANRATVNPISSPDVAKKRQDSTSAPWRSIRLESVSRQRWFLAVLTCACLLPFVNEAFHIDAPLFLWAAKQIVKHPLDPYGFSVVWYTKAMTMSEVTKNPPLAAYFMALAGSWAGWSEWVLHVEFLLPSVAMVLGVHQLARGMTRSPLLAAAVTVAAPGFLISATSVMCDVPMLALWLFAIICWRKGICEEKFAWLAIGGVLIGVCALTKYFGICLIPLLFLFSIWEKRRIGGWISCLVIPVAMLAAYQLWTNSLYAHGALSSLGSYVQYVRSATPTSPAANLMVTVSFVGGCALPALLFVPVCWSRKWVIAAGSAAILGTAAILLNWISLGNAFPDQYRGLLAGQFGLFVLGGLAVVSLAVSDFWRNRDSDSVLLLAWVLGTFVFAGFVNWTVNGRSVLPMIPAVALLLARRLQSLEEPGSIYASVVPLVLSLGIGLWAMAGDAALANSARTAATEIHHRGVREMKRILFPGHWGFQYYMEALGGVPLDSAQSEVTLLDLLVVPHNNSNVDLKIPPEALVGSLSIPIDAYSSTMRPELAAGFYSSLWGPLPFAFAPVPEERYDFYQLNQFGR